ncbi:hypothetical protein L2E82_31703 [Cichorium intybus]|uniref:Uncharacterized protein n=1 Tax=Cichorium intybus TaxID=13427 RepID=A0ACB9BEN9_CICIN|nr:hypothetical protein L2E82_31703 [Cichorium intybus]
MLITHKIYSFLMQPNLGHKRSTIALTAQLIIGTPGTINKWIAAKKLATSHLKILVFDEVDHMLAEEIVSYETTTIQGALTQEDRDKIVEEFKDVIASFMDTFETEGQATDVLARGFDQAQVNLVGNYVLPVKHDDPMKCTYSG